MSEKQTPKESFRGIEIPLFPNRYPELGQDQEAYQEKLMREIKENFPGHRSALQNDLDSIERHASRRGGFATLLLRMPEEREDEFGTAEKVVGSLPPETEAIMNGIYRMVEAKVDDDVIYDSDPTERRVTSRVGHFYGYPIWFEEHVYTAGPTTEDKQEHYGQKVLQWFVASAPIHRRS